MKLNFKNTSNICKHCLNDITKTIQEYFDKMELVYDNFDYSGWEFDEIECQHCFTKYNFKTSDMQVSVELIVKPED